MRSALRTDVSRNMSRKAEFLRKRRSLVTGKFGKLKSLISLSQIFFDTAGGFKCVLDAIAHRDTSVKVTAKIYPAVVFFKFRASLSYFFVTDSVLRNRFFPTFDVNEVW